jgi:hypothetical protein
VERRSETDVRTPNLMISEKIEVSENYSGLHVMVFRLTLLSTVRSSTQVADEGNNQLGDNIGSFIHAENFLSFCT